MVRLISPPVPLLLRLSSPAHGAAAPTGRHQLPHWAWLCSSAASDIAPEPISSQGLVCLSWWQTRSAAGASPSRMPLTRLLKPSLSTDSETATHPEPRSFSAGCSSAIIGHQPPPPPLKVSLQLSARPGLADCTPHGHVDSVASSQGSPATAGSSVRGCAVCAACGGIPAGLLVFGGESVHSTLLRRSIVRRARTAGLCAAGLRSARAAAISTTVATWTERRSADPVCSRKRNRCR